MYYDPSQYLNIWFKPTGFSICSGQISLCTVTAQCLAMDCGRFSESGRLNLWGQIEQGCYLFHDTGEKWLVGVRMPQVVMTEKKSLISSSSFYFITCPV